MKKIFIITYQPKEKSDKEEYLNTFIQESEKIGNEIKTLNIHDIEVEYLKFNGNDTNRNLTPELKEAQDNIVWADQIVLVYSVWCMNVPAKLKAFIEQIFQEGVLIKLGPKGPEPLLKNKTLVVMQSYGMPYLFMKYFFKDVPFNFIKIALEKWCGFKIVKRFDIDMIDNINEKRNKKIINDIKKFVNK